MGSQKINESRAFKVALIYMVEERTKGKIAELYKQLQTCGIEVFLFSKDMPTVESHEAEMQKQIKHADAVIICYSEDFEKGRGYRHQEVTIALKEQTLRPPGNAYLLPIRLDDCKVPDYLSGPRVLDYFQRDHIDGILRWGLVVRRKQLLEEGQNIKAFTYDFPQQSYKTEETVLLENVQLPANRAESSGVWNVPYRRNPCFTGRDELLDRLDQQLSSEEHERRTTTYRAALTQPQAIKGLGGIGKTQIAVEYAYRSFEKKRYHHIFWINAAAETLMISSFVEIAKQLEIAKQFPPFFVRDDRNHTELIAAVKRWLEECQRRWLLIFDNVEAEDFSLVQTYFPQRGDGSILLTTRAHSVSSLGASSIEVEKMEVLEGTKLLLRLVERFEQAFHTLDEVRDDEKTRVVIDEALATTIDEATNLVLVLDCFPLALEQAGAYIEETECSLTEYRRLYQTHRQTLLARKRRRKPNATDYPASVATTWSLSFQKVEQANPAAAELLCLCAFLAPDEIPEELITESAAHWTRLLQEAASDADAFNEMIAELLKYSLVKRLADVRTLSIHRLVQVVQMDTMNAEEQRQWAERVVLAVDKIFPEKDARTLEDEKQHRRYLGQVQACSTLLRQYKLLLLEGADVLTRAGWYIKPSSPDRAELIFEQAFEIREQLAEADDPALAKNLFALAASYTDARKSSTRGQFGKAEDLFLRALAIQEEHLGNNHLDTASTLHQLAILYMGQGRYTEAEPFFLRSLHIREQAWGPEDLRLIEPLNAITIIYTLREKYAEAEEFVQHRDRLEELKNREEGIRPLATGVLAEDVWRSSLRYLKNRPD